MYKIVVPGDFLSTDIRRAGEGTYVENGKVYALRYGILDDKDEIRVVPLSGRYIPKRGDVVIGRVEDIMYPYWVFDIASPYKGLLHVRNSRRRSNTGRWIDFCESTTLRS